MSYYQKNESSEPYRIVSDKDSFENSIFGTHFLLPTYAINATMRANLIGGAK